MPTASEAAGQTQVSTALDAGIESLSQSQTVGFMKYERFALDSDASVFWVATPETATVKGSLHYATDRRQDEDQTIGANHFILTSEEEISQLNAIAPSSMWIGSWAISGTTSDAQSQVLQIAFSGRGGYYKEADKWHYTGFAVYPALSSQILSSAADIPAGPIVSNSLPIWLAEDEYIDGNGNPVAVPVYPSFLVPDNIAPPYIVAHIEPVETEALASFPLVGPWPGDTVPDSGASPLHRMDSSQLCRDSVTLTLYGFSNQSAIQYLAGVIDDSINQIAPFGLANSPVIRDEKRPQVEIAALAQKKTIHILANYYQGAADVIARRLILEAMVTIDVLGGAMAKGIGATTQDEQRVNAIATVTE